MLSAVHLTTALYSLAHSDDNSTQASSHMPHARSPSSGTSTHTQPSPLCGGLSPSLVSSMASLMNLFHPSLAVLLAAGASGLLEASSAAAKGDLPDSVRTGGMLLPPGLWGGTQRGRMERST